MSGQYTGPEPTLQELKDAEEMLLHDIAIIDSRIAYRDWRFLPDAKRDEALLNHYNTVHESYFEARKNREARLERVRRAIRERENFRRGDTEMKSLRASSPTTRRPGKSSMSTSRSCSSKITSSKLSQQARDPLTGRFITSRRQRF